MLRFIDLQSGRRIPTSDEARRLAGEAERRIAELRTEIERLKRERP